MAMEDNDIIQLFFDRNEQAIAETSAKYGSYCKVMLWVFEENIRAINFYKKHGFSANGRSQKALGAVEVMYERNV